jgi:predicted metal-dependent peptidase
VSALPADERSWFDRYVVDSGFLQRYPFYASVLAQVGFATTDRVPVMAARYCDHRFTLLLNEQFFAKRPRYLAGVLLHEVHHIVLGHLVHPRFFDVERPDLLQLAMEMSANEYIAEPLPGPIVWSGFQEFGLLAHQSTLTRYQLLLQHRQRFDAAHPRRAVFVDHHGGDGLPGTGIFELVTGLREAGHAVPALRLLLERAARIAADVGGAADPDPAAAALERMLARLQHPFAGGCRFDGRLLGRSLDAVLAALAPAPGGGTVDWRHALRDFVRRGSEPVFHRPNRRQPQRVFELPGRSWRGGESEILVAIDTSGSIDDRELAAVARELGSLSRRARITIAECDDKVRRVYRYDGRLANVLGRGGTDLRPPFAPELLQRHGRDGIVYFTDGEGPWPRRPPPVPVLWVLTRHGRAAFGCPFGRQVFLRAAPAPASVPVDDEVPF